MDVTSTLQLWKGKSSDHCYLFSNTETFSPEASKARGFEKFLEQFASEAFAHLCAVGMAKGVEWF